MPTSHTLIIIGGGPAGLNVAIAAAKAGIDYLILEKGVLVNSIYHFPTNMTFFSTSELLEIGGIPFIAHHDKPTRQEALEYYRRIQQAYDIKVNNYETVAAMSRQADGRYLITTQRGTYLATYVVIATGFYDTPRLMNVPGEDLPKVKHYYDDAHPYVDQEVLVVGAANSACDVALETWQKGAQVTMAVREEEIYEGVKYWIRPNILNRIKEGSIKAYFNTEVTAIREREVDLATPDGPITLANDFVLAMTGYQPNYALLERLGLDIPEDYPRIPVHDPETLETHLPNVYMAGVLCAGMQTSKLFIENTRAHGAQIIDHIAAQVF